MEPEGSRSHSEVSATCPYPEPDQSCPCLPSHFLKIQFSIILPFMHTQTDLPSGLFPSHFPTQTLYAPLLFPTHATRPTHLILPDLKNLQNGIQTLFKNMSVPQEEGKLLCAGLSVLKLTEVLKIKISTLILY